MAWSGGNTAIVNMKKPKQSRHQQKIDYSSAVAIVEGLFWSLGYALVADCNVETWSLYRG